MKYEITGGDLPVVVCYPEAGQTIITERGSMSWMSDNMRMETKGGGIGKMFGRFITKESVFQNRYTAEGKEGMIAFASSFPGKIVPLEICPGNEIIVQKGGFLAGESTIELSTHFQQKLSSGFFGGEGFIMQKLSGNGTAFIEIDGSVTEYELKPGEVLYVDTGYVAAMSASCRMEIEMIKGFKNIVFGGEGLFNTKITGPGKVYLQSMPTSAVAMAIYPHLPRTN